MHQWSQRHKKADFFWCRRRNGDLLRWCLGNGLRVRYSRTLMTVGLYDKAAWAYLPSILY
jgi:hypothetical protein